MCQSENATQPHMFAIAVGGDQPDVRLLCQPSLAANRSLYILACALLRKNRVGGAKNSTVLQL